MDSIISTFHIDWKIIAAQAVNFAVVFAVLYYFALRPLSYLMLKRTEKIVKGIADAKTNAETLAKTHAEYAKAIADAKAEANKIFQDGKKEAEANRAKMLEEARTEVSVLLANGKKALEADKAKMVEEVKKEVVSLAMAAAEKILSEKIDGNFNAKTVKELGNL